MLTQATFDLKSLLRWRDTFAFEGPVYAGVLVVASAPMAKTLQAATRQISVPDALIDKLDEDRDAGIDAACTLLETIEDSGAFDGAHLIPVGRFRQVAARLEALGPRGSNRAPK